jgi:hypothetical protein
VGRSPKHTPIRSRSYHRNNPQTAGIIRAIEDLDEDHADGRLSAFNLDRAYDLVRAALARAHREAEADFNYAGDAITQYKQSATPEHLSSASGQRTLAEMEQAAEQAGDEMERLYSAAIISRG